MNSLVVTAVCMATLAFACVGCKSKSSSPPPRTYQTKGVVQHITNHKLVIHHEAIKDFVHSDGVPAGMRSMTMTMQVDAKVSIAGIKRGDKIAFDLNVNWDRNPPLLITKIKGQAPVRN